MRSSEARRGRCGEGDRGSVTAEAAVAVPALVVFAMALVWALMAASAQIQCVDAARAGARAAARSEPPAAAVAAARSAAPDGARVTVGRAGDLWRVRVEAAAPGPGALGLTLSAEAAAFAEDAVGGSRLRFDAGRRLGAGCRFGHGWWLGLQPDGSHRVGRGSGAGRGRSRGPGRCIEPGLDSGRGGGLRPRVPKPKPKPSPRRLGRALRPGTGPLARARLSFRPAPGPAPLGGPEEVVP